MRTATLDGKHIAYTDDTRFEVQIGRGKSAYKTRYTLTGNLHQAVLYYQGINIGRGYKKRLVMPDAMRPVLARAFS
jgi:hypothetical protein